MKKRSFGFAVTISAFIGIVAVPSAAPLEMSFTAERSEGVIQKPSGLNATSESVSWGNEETLNGIADLVVAKYWQTSLTGITVNEKTNSMWIWFYPNVPTRLFEIKAQYPHVNFIFEISKYSRVTLDLQMKDLFMKLGNAGVEVSSVSIPSDGSGLYVSPQPGTPKKTITEFLSQIQLTISSRDIVIGEPESTMPLPTAVIISSEPTNLDIIDYGIVWTK